MTWQLIAKKKYKQGIKGMQNESSHFVALINSFNQKMNFRTDGELKHEDLLPEGSAWLLNLHNGFDMYVEQCSYEVKNVNIKYIWIEFLTNSRELIAEINKINGEKIKEVLLSTSEIIDFYPN